LKPTLFSLMALAAVLAVAGTGSFAYFSDIETSTSNTFTAGTWSIEVEIDIKPGSFPNSINLDSQGVIPVAILTTDDFDAHFVDGKTVRFGPQEAQAEHWALEDVDSDGDEDMILHFRTQDTGIRAGDTEAELRGETVHGWAIYGSDSVRTVPPWDDEQPKDTERAA